MTRQVARRPGADEELRGCDGCDQHGREPQCGEARGRVEVAGREVHLPGDDPARRRRKALAESIPKPNKEALVWQEQVRKNNSEKRTSQEEGLAPAVAISKSGGKPLFLTCSFF